MTEPDPAGTSGLPNRRETLLPGRRWHAAYQAVRRGRRSANRVKRPYYGFQHNRRQVEVELSPETLAATGAAICRAILTIRRLADVSPACWEHQTPADTDDQGPLLVPAVPGTAELRDLRM